jgi:peptide deformylase
MILEIKKYPNPILRKKSEKVEKVTPEIKKLIEDMTEAMEKNDGVGLAAPQIGELKRIIVIKTNQGPKAFINPKILNKSRKTETLEEGCLSFPGLFLRIKRAKEIEIEAFDEKSKKIKAEGILAKVLQHEIDHLDGILFIDKISFWQKLKIRNKLKNYGSY